jgi:hypothetical protein
MFGILLDQHKTIDTLKSEDVLIAMFAPIVVPIIFGMFINDKYNEQ